MLRSSGARPRFNSSRRYECICQLMGTAAIFLVSGRSNFEFQTPPPLLEFAMSIGNSKCLNNVLVHCELLATAAPAPATSHGASPGVLPGASDTADDVLDDTLPLNFWEKNNEEKGEAGATGIMQSKEEAAAISPAAKRQKPGTGVEPGTPPEQMLESGSDAQPLWVKFRGEEKTWNIHTLDFKHEMMLENGHPHVYVDGPVVEEI
eukprot:Skav230877  [mRNA]  locus=scaffold1995:145974:146591:- [translate_table: standard]